MTKPYIVHTDIFFHDPEGREYCDMADYIYSKNGGNVLFGTQDGKFMVSFMMETTDHPGSVHGAINLVRSWGLLPYRVVSEKGE